MGSTDIFNYLLGQLDNKDRAEVKGYIDALLGQGKYKNNVLQFRKDGKNYGEAEKEDGKES